MEGKKKKQTNPSVNCVAATKNGAFPRITLLMQILRVKKTEWYTEKQVMQHKQGVVDLGRALKQLKHETLTPFTPVYTTPTLSPQTHSLKPYRRQLGCNQVSWASHTSAPPKSAHHNPVHCV
jgi:hypothetical protein